MLSGEEVRVEIKDGSLDVIRGTSLILIIILNGSNLISSPSVNGESMKKSSVRVSLCEPIYSGFHSPKFLLTTEDVGKISLKESFKRVEERTMGIFEDFWMPVNLARIFFFLWKMLPKVSLFHALTTHSWEEIASQKEREGGKKSLTRSGEVG